MNQHRKKRSYLYLIVSLFALLFFAFPQSHGTVQADEPSRIPSAAPEGSFFRWKTSGFKTQPKELYNVKRGSRVDIKTKFVKKSSILPWRGEAKYKWYQSTDQIKWTEMSNKNSADLSFETDKNDRTHDFYYQAVVNYRKVNYYSKIAHVHITDKEKPASSLHLTADIDYLYSIDTKGLFDNLAYVDANLDPVDSTGDIQWTLGEFKGADVEPVRENELATINSEGLVTAKENAEGELLVTGYVVYNDGSVIYDQENISIGGGLKDVVSHVNQNATFNIQTGNIKTRGDQLDDVKIQWHQIKHGKDTLVNNNNSDPLSLTTHKLDETDNENQYYAVITLDRLSFSTKKAKLTVKPQLEPTVHVDSWLKNNDYIDALDSDLNLHNVASNDSIKYTLTMKNGGLKDLVKSSLNFNLNQYLQIDTITLDNSAVSYTSKNLTGTLQEISIPITTLSHDAEHVVEVTLKAAGINKNNSYSIQPVLSGYYDDMKQEYESDGQVATLNFTDNSIKAKFRAINFEPIMAYEKNIIKYRTDESTTPNPIVNINDHRREKNPVKLFVKQCHPFVNDQGETLDAGLEFFDQESTPIAVGQSVPIAQIEKNQTVKSIYWDKHQGLLLRLNAAPLKAAEYNTTLQWSFQNSI